MQVPLHQQETPSVLYQETQSRQQDHPKQTIHSPKFSRKKNPISI